jgi:hypothetical protein
MQMINNVSIALFLSTKSGLRVNMVCVRNLIIKNGLTFINHRTGDTFGPTSALCLFAKRL